MPPLRTFLAAFILAIFFLAAPAAPAAADSAPSRDAVSEASHAASASLLSPYRPAGNGDSLSTVQLVGLIVACALPALVLVLRNRDRARAR